jgi:pimeloyl-ACP methyl ester carboxylesterase|eukprot:TRINITY_DN2220_c0_g1_i1.p2 TRINITY_DN2220_c0_g1~~TRINITY_DN2220_c0_g1_i1.p2  ORF type:complete len:508 (+),score=259.30 TRINITY_DN2220_c0_g1_i1:26-1525(+)
MRSALLCAVAAVSALTAEALPFGNMLNRALEAGRHGDGITLARNPFAHATVNPPTESRFTTQKVDHFNNYKSDTWSQRYFYNTQFCATSTKCNCVLLVIGGEGPLSGGYLTETTFPIYASKAGCALFALEHRGYGNSYPSSDLSIQSLTLISSQQALADLAYFAREVIQKQMDISGPIITVGGSYSGALAAWARIKYPIFAGALASSAPVHAIQDFAAYLQVVTRSLSNTAVGGSAACFSAVSSAVLELSGRVAVGSSLSEYKLCEPLGSQRDVSNFMSLVIGSFQGIVQYNSPAAAPANVATVCNAFTTSSDLQATLVNTTLQLNALTSTGCLDASYSSMINSLSNTTAGPAVGGRSWLWQTATQFGYYQTTTNLATTWGSQLPLEFSIQIINDLFSVSGPQNEANIDWTQTYYGGLNPTFASRTAWINGGVDPWHVLSSLSVPSDSGDIVIFIPSGSHCQDWHPADPSSEVGQAQVKILAALQQFIAPFNGGGIRRA